MKRTTSRYGLPYKGSKNKIARWVADVLPVNDNFYDLFCGGCSITHVMLEQGQYQRYVCNDIIPQLPRLFDDAAHGRLDLDYHWVSREQFFREAKTDFITNLVYSFGMGGIEKGYIYGKKNEDFKHAYHDAVVHRNVEPMKTWGYDLTPILEADTISERYLRAKPIIKSRVKRSDLIIG